MEQHFQQTLKQTVQAQGVGLHSGLPIKVTLKPWPIGGGLVFRRSDLPGAPLIPALAQNVVDTKLATTLGAEGVTISTVEHLMAALAALGVDNALVEVDGPEMPVLDGSATPWVELITKSGLLSQMAPRKYYRVVRPFSFTEGDKFFQVEPGFNFSLKNQISFADPIGRQACDFVLNPETFARELAPARTFCLAREIEYMQSLGLAKGGSLDNAVVVGDHGVVNPEGLRFPDEFVRHKALDLVGDLALAGAPIIGRITAFKAGHDLNHKFVTALLAAKGVLEPIQAPEFAARPARITGHLDRPSISCAWGFPGEPVLAARGAAL